MSTSSDEKVSMELSRSNSHSDKSIEWPSTSQDHLSTLENPEDNVTDAAPSPVALRPTFSERATSVNTTGTNNPDFEVDWDDEKDPTNPRNWPLWYKGMTIGFISWSTWCVVVYSTSYTTGLAEMGKDFHVSSEPIVTMGVTSYLIGLAVGSMILAPISEMYGRRPVYIVSMLAFTLLIIPCALATSLTEVIIVRFFGAIAGSAMIANSPGTVADIVSDDYRALAFSIWSIGPLNGPTFGPIIGGFSTQYLGWRWTNWIVMMISGVAFGFVCVLKESYAPALLKKKAKLRREEQNDDRYWSRYDNKKTSLIALLKVNLSRPFIMIVTEPICIFWDIYIAIIYGILYLCFVAYPIAFTDIRGWSRGLTGLAFTGLAIGCFLIIGLEPLIRRMINSHKKDQQTGKVPPEAMVSIVCIAAVLAPMGQLWFAWTCVPPAHWIWPVLSGIPFGAGTTAVFIYASNYLAQSYGIYAASAMAGNSVIRSILGGTLPLGMKLHPNVPCPVLDSQSWDLPRSMSLEKIFSQKHSLTGDRHLAGPAMYAKLDPHWAGTLLGLIQIAIIPIPVLFYKYGYKIRMKSTLILSMQQDQERLESKRRNGKTLAKKEKRDKEIEKV